MKRTFVSTSNLYDLVNHYQISHLSGLNTNVIVDNLFNVIMAATLESNTTMDYVVTVGKNYFKLLIGEFKMDFPWLVFDMAFEPMVRALGITLYSINQQSTILRHYPMHVNNNPVPYHSVEYV